MNTIVSIAWALTIFAAGGGAVIGFLIFALYWRRPIPPSRAEQIIRESRRVTGDEPSMRKLRNRHLFLVTL